MLHSRDVDTGAAGRSLQVGIDGDADVLVKKRARTG